MIYILFLIAFLGLWAVINFLFKSLRGGSLNDWPNLLPKFKLPQLPALKLAPQMQSSQVPAESKSPSSGLEIQNLIKEYKSGSSLIKAVDIPKLLIQNGEFMAIMGRSGSGKSSLLNILGALDKPTSGVVFLNQKDLASLSSNELSRLRNDEIGFIFQQANLIASLTAVENVELPLKYAGVNHKERRLKALKVLEAVGLKSRTAHFPAQLSGGEAQRVTIARALVNDPTLVLADEPTGEVDSQTSNEIISLMKNLNKKFGTTFIIVTHDPLVAQSTNRVLRLQDGKILSDKRVIKIDGAYKAEVDLV